MLSKSCPQCDVWYLELQHRSVHQSNYFSKSKWFVWERDGDRGPNPVILPSDQSNEKSFLNHLMESSNFK